MRLPNARYVVWQVILIPGLFCGFRHHGRVLIDKDYPAIEYRCGAEKKAFLILDNLQVYHSKLVKQWAEEHKGKLNCSI